MLLFSRSIAALVDDMLRVSQQERTLITLPSYPAPFMLAIAREISRLAAAHKVTLLLKISQDAFKDWDADAKQEAQRHDWPDTHGNLTYYRNNTNAQAASLVMLCGVDKIRDTASLEDFTLCDESYLWNMRQARLFTDWIQERLADYQKPVPDAEHLRAMEDVLETLRLLPGGGLLKISQWLDELDMADFRGGKELLRGMLSALGPFGLPNCGSFTDKKRKKTRFVQYAKSALPFFEYESFIKAKGRAAARRAIEAFQQRLADDEPRACRLAENADLYFPTYPSITDFLDGLLRYITDNTQEDRAKLMACDFVQIRDVVLQSRQPGPVPNTSPKQLYGPLLESLLTSLWLTLDLWKKNRREQSEDIPVCLRLRGASYAFSHEEMLEGDGPPLGNIVHDLALAQIKHVLDGADYVLETYLQGDGHNQSASFFVKSQLIPDDMPTQSTRKTPHFVFSVELATNATAEAFFSRSYAWVLPEKHGEWLNAELVRRADAWCRHNLKACLPVFHFTYYEELLTAPDDEDTRELLRHSLRDDGNTPFAVNLLTDATSAHLLPDLKYLAACYAEFMELAAEKSVLHALFTSDSAGSGPWRKLCTAYTDVLRKARELTCQGHANLSSIPMRAFLAVQQRNAEQGMGWCSDAYEDSGIVTVLHPALLEQMQAQCVFLCACFNKICQAVLSDKKSRAWRHYVSLAQMQTPLSTLPRSPGGQLAGALRGHGYIHKIGHIEQKNFTTLSTRLHSEGERSMEKLSDTDLFQENEESMLLERLLRQYYVLRPQAWDGINLAIFRNTDVQPIIAAVHAFLKHLASEAVGTISARRAAPYEVRLAFFSGSNDAAHIRTWLSHWQERWEAACSDDADAHNAYYRYCRFTISHRLTTDHEALANLVRQDELDVDIALLYGIVSMGETHGKFVPMERLDVTGADLKFPILEKKYCASRKDVESLRRSRIISLRQFAIASEHACLMHALSSPDTAPESSLVVATGDFSHWKTTLTNLHKAADWVICIDPAVDEALIRDSALPDHPRDIIAFGSGVGTHGEANYTISSEQLSCQDLCAHVRRNLISLYGTGVLDNATCTAMANNLLHAEKLAGLALIRAASLKDNHIREFLAYSLSRRLLHTDTPLCDVMISLDAYRHWFSAADECRPDLFWVTGEERQGRIHLRVRLVECKLGHASESAVCRAHEQLRSGLRVLEPLFRPKVDDNLDDDRPDRRYWWHQMHRVITSRIDLHNEAEVRRLALLLEQLADGLYSIEWEALLLTYWTDNPGDTVTLFNAWLIDGMPARHCIIGRRCQQRLASEEDFRPWTEFDTLAEDLLAQEEDEKYTQTLPDAIDTDAEAQDDTGISVDDEDDIPDWQRHYLASDVLEHTDRQDVPPMTLEQERLFDDLWNTNTADAQSIPTPDGIAPLTDAALPQTIKGEPASQTLSVQAEVPGARIPEQVLLGADKHGRPIYWRFRDADNRHLLIFGRSGGGKTYAIQCLLAEIARSGMNTMILDYSQSFMPNELQPPVRCYFPEQQQHFVAMTPLPINPFLRHSLTFGEKIIPEAPLNVANRMTDIFKNIFQLGKQQVNVLREAITECLQTLNDTASLHGVEDILDAYRQDGRHNKNTIDSLQSYVHNFALTNPFAPQHTENGWEWIYRTTPSCNHVFQLAHIVPSIAAGIIEFVLWDLFFHTQRTGNTSQPSVVVLDEIQNLSLDEGSPVDKFLREGRKFGLALIAATQSFSGVKSALSVLNQAAHKLYFRPADNELAECGKQLHDVDSTCSAADWKERLSRLKRGECYVVGPTGSQERPVRFVKIASMEDRGFGL